MVIIRRRLSSAARRRLFWNATPQDLAPQRLAQTVGLRGTDRVERERRIRITSDTDIVAAREEGRSLGAALKFSTSDLAFIATAISEVARNILTYAGSGEIAIGLETKAGRQGVTVVARDQGPGILDLTLAMQEGYSTSGGLGLGLPGVRRLMDDFEIWSEPGRGTVVTMRRWATR